MSVICAHIEIKIQADIAVCICLYVLTNTSIYEHAGSLTEGLLAVSPYVKDPPTSNPLSMQTNPRQPPPTRRRQLRLTLSSGGDLSGFVLDK
jgi:hypothetical protein